MKHSEQLNEIAAAMSKLQGEIEDASKDTSGYGYKYADLSQVLGIIRPLLSKNGLSFTQHVSNADDKIIIETMLMHSSGQWMSSEIAMPPVQGKSMNAAQAVGSIITYGRRYALTAIFGITQTDDDGAPDKPRMEEPKKAQQEYKKPLPQTVPQPPEVAPMGREQVKPPVAAGVESVFLSKDQVFKLSKMIFDAKIDAKLIYDKYKVTSYEQLTNAQAKEIASECSARYATV
jgi:hypothetical protein